MSSKKRAPGRPAPKRGKQQSSTASSLAIPIAVGVAVVAIIAFAIISLENRQPAVAAVPGDISVPIVTAQPRPTTQIPYPDVPRVSVQDMKALMDAGKAILVDVRSKSAFDQSHAAGAISIPEEEMSARTNELPRDKDVVLYCTWGQEQQSARVAQVLRDQGLSNVKALLGGFAAWQRAEFPLESANEQ